MAFFYKDAELKLLDHLAKLGDRREFWRVAVFPASQMEKSNKRQVTDAAAIQHIQKMALEAEISAYLCHDADLVFTFTGLKRRLIPKLVELITLIMPNLRTEDVDLDTAFRFYDLGVDYTMVAQFMREKVKLYQQSSDADAPANLAGAELLPEWDGDRYQQVALDQASRTKPLILIIDDDDMIRNLARSVLRPPYSVILAGDGIAGMDIANRYAPDLILLDIEMPHVSGVETLKRIMQHMPEAKVIMFSASSQEANVKEAIALGAKGFITKPFAPKSLLTRVSKALTEE